MERRTHIIFGIFLFVVLWGALKLDLIFSALAGIGAMLPDLDYKKTPDARHRKVAHNVWVLIAISAAIFLFTSSFEFAAAFALGFLSHILADSLTPLGVYPLYPFRKQRAWFLVRGKAVITTGSRGEKAFQIVFAALTVVLFFWVSGVL
jgi:membrane-bound metal-dependent hydrolase YbcI (DUF457 family)